MPSLINQSDNLSLRDIKKYRDFNPTLYRRLLGCAKKLKGKVVVHINATAIGGGVAELLASQVAMERSLGIKSYWLTMNAPKDFFEVTKKIHNLLQSKPDSLTEEEKILYLSANREIGVSLAYFLEKFSGGIVFIHDPQPIPLVRYIPKNFVPILRLHIDLSAPSAETLEFLRPFIERYKFVVSHSNFYFRSFLWLSRGKRKVIMNSIDPLSTKNRPMELLAAQNILEKFGINCTRPIISQVSRFDPWKDPMGVIKAYYIAKNAVPDLQLVLAGFSFAKDDSEAEVIFRTVERHAKGDPDIFLFSNSAVLKEFSNDIFISAVYTASDVVLQKSIKEGFGLTMTEAMWKGKPLVAGRTIGAMMQIKNGKNGILVSSPQEAAKAMVRILKNKKLAQRLGKAAHESVKKNFLFSRYLLDHAKLYIEALRMSK